MNTRIEYLYRDGSNYKIPNQQIVEGTLTDRQIKEIIASCDDGEYFVPRQVGLPEDRFGDINDDDHAWFEIQEIVSVDGTPTVDMTAEELYQNFVKASGNWDETLWMEGGGE